MTTTNRTTVVGVFTDRDAAEQAIEALHRADFEDNQIGFIIRDQDSGKSLADQSAVATGAISGGVLGGVLGAAIVLLIPGVGPAIAGGILTATLSGVAVGAMTGGLIGALVDMGIPEDEAHYYRQELIHGHAIVIVQAFERYGDALNILRVNGAYDVHTRPDATDSPGTSARPDYAANEVQTNAPAWPTYTPPPREAYPPPMTSSAAPIHTPGAPSPPAPQVSEDEARHQERHESDDGGG